MVLVCFCVCFLDFGVLSILWCFVVNRCFGTLCRFVTLGVLDFWVLGVLA